jgi:hypothetical protein
VSTTVATAVNLAGVLVLYFAVPVRAEASAVRVVGGVALTAAGLVVVGWIVVREVRAVASGRQQALGARQLLLLLEFVFVLFALAFYVLDVHGEGQVAGLSTRIDALYYSASTMTTAGFGDVHATGQAARALATMQLLFNAVFIALLVRLLARSTRVGQARDAARE